MEIIAGTALRDCAGGSAAHERSYASHSAGLLLPGFPDRRLRRTGTFKKSYEALTARYEKAKVQLDEVTASIHDKRSRCQSILDLLEQQDRPVQKYDARLWHGMVDHVTVFSKDDIRFTMKDGTEIQA